MTKDENQLQWCSATRGASLVSVESRLLLQNFQIVFMFSSEFSIFYQERFSEKVLFSTTIHPYALVVECPSAEASLAT